MEGFTARELIDLCLGQTAEWTEAYEDAMGAAGAEPGPTPADRARLDALAKAERKAADALWAGDPEAALRTLLAAKDDAFKEDRNLGAWLLHWAGLAAQLAGDSGQAADLYRQAARVKRDLGALPEAGVATPAADASAASPQAGRMADLLRARGAGRVTGDLAKGAADREPPLFHAAEIEAGLAEHALTWGAIPGAMETVRLDAL